MCVPDPRRIRGWLGLLGVLLLSGCGTSSRRASYPIGIFGANTPEALHTVRQAGFNCVVGSGAASYLDAAAGEGLRVLARVEGLTKTQLAEADAHPALWSWYVVDEPDMVRLSPRQVADRVRELRRQGLRKPSALTLWGGREADRYGRLTDWLLIDRYPVPWLPLADFPKHLRLGRFAAGPQRPVLAVVQAFDWSAFPAQFPSRPGLRAPSYAELRAMAFLALLEGSQGIFFYTYRAEGGPGFWDLRANPETWEAVVRVVQELRTLEPLFLSRPEWRDFQVRYPDSATQWNEVFDPAIQAATVTAREAASGLRPGRYLVAVNTTPREVTWQCRWKIVAPARLSEFGAEDRGIQPDASGWYSVRFRPYDARIFGPLAAEPEESR